MNTKLPRIAMVALGLTLALPGVAQPHAMQDMPMPAPASAAPAPAPSARSLRGTNMQGMHMPSMRGVQHGISEAKQSAKDTKGATKANPPTASFPRKRESSDFHAGKATILDARLRGHDEQGSTIHSMSGMPSMSDTSSTQDMHVQPSHPVQMQHLHFGNMIGTRPEPGGLAGSMQGMNMSSMQGMDMSSMQGGKAPADARSPDYSDGYRHTDMPGMAMSDHAREGMLLIDHLEYARDNHGNDAVFLDGQFWYGRDFNKLWLKFEGEQAGGKLEDLRTEALWNHAISAYWDTQLGVRHDYGEGPGRTWAAFGVEGLAPYWFETETTFYVGQGGRTAARMQFEFEELLTQRLILQPKLEVNLYGKDDPQRGIGSGLSNAELGLRLRYEIRREFAPYIGVVWRQRLGKTADFARMRGELAGELQFVAGLHFWF